MTRHIVDSDLRVYEPGNTSTLPSFADHTVDGSDILGADIETQLQGVKDTAKIDIDNDGASYTDDLDIGDRVAFRTQLEGESSMSHRWTGLVREIEHTVRGPVQRDMTLTCEDFVFGIMSMRHVTNSFEDQVVSGTSDDIIETIVGNNAPEIDLSGVGATIDSISVNFQRTNLLEAIRRIRDQVDIIMDANETQFILLERSDLSVNFALESSDIVGNWKHTETDEAMANAVLIDGVRDVALDIEQTNHDDTERVTDSSRRTQQISVRKGEIASIEIDVVPDSNDDNMIVRLQADDGSGSPKSPGDTQSDLARTEVGPGNLTDGMNKFKMPENNLPDPNPHILVEAGGGTGHDVRIDSSIGELAYRVFYYYPVVPQSRSQSSIDEYRRREGRYRRESVTGRSEGNKIVSGILSRRDDPGGELSFLADSTRAHNLSTRDVLNVHRPDVGASDDYVVTSVSDRYDGTKMTTEVSAKTRENI